MRPLLSVSLVHVYKAKHYCQWQPQWSALLTNREGNSMENQDGRKKGRKIYMYISIFQRGLWHTVELKD